MTKDGAKGQSFIFIIGNNSYKDIRYKFEMKYSNILKEASNLVFLLEDEKTKLDIHKTFKHAFIYSLRDIDDEKSKFYSLLIDIMYFHFLDSIENPTFEDKIELNDNNETKIYIFKDPVSKDIIQKVNNYVNVIDKFNYRNILITGPTGTGKEIVARYFHKLICEKYNNDNDYKKFEMVNINAIPETLFQSILFGHVRGAFTDATRNQAGIVENLGKGTLFLDEIGDNENIINMILTFVENRNYKRLGSNGDTNVFEGTIIVATEKEIPREAFIERFPIHISMPKLDDRKADKKELTLFFIKEYKKQFNKEGIVFDEQIIEYIANLKYPRNIRQLSNLIKDLIIHEGGKITKEKVDKHYYYRYNINVSSDITNSKIKEMK